VTLTDAGPLIALVNRNDPNHAACVAGARQLVGGPMITTWPCFTEAMYLLHRAGGYLAQAALWQLRSMGRLVFHDAGASEIGRMAELMDIKIDRWIWPMPRSWLPRNNFD